MNKRQKKKLAHVLLWRKLKLLGGEKQDTYVRVLSSEPVGSGALYKGDYARVREDLEDDEVFVWLQNKKQRAEQVLHASWGIDNGGFGQPYTTHEFEIVWKDGKPV
ncbi:hypothetical protein [Exiguobacterium antarcticum]|uniref:hypothetical protein n=1 Tax=Exiguobacterium antarcticum TaxID=132920 RepID=UPI00047D102F|nr:hypothetical protein [Exiguobacterium antarcticum]